VNDPKRPHVYAWEIVVTMRKVSVMCVAVYFYESPPVQGICVCLYICIAHCTRAMFLSCPTYDTHPCTYTYTRHAHAVILGLVVIISALCLQITQNPFESILLNRAEAVSIECAC
jgi:hypothetical protein